MRSDFSLKSWCIGRFCHHLYQYSPSFLCWRHFSTSRRGKLGRPELSTLTASCFFSREVLSLFSSNLHFMGREALAVHGFCDGCGRGDRRPIPSHARADFYLCKKSPVVFAVSGQSIRRCLKCIVYFAGFVQCTHRDGWAPTSRHVRDLAVRAEWSGQQSITSIAYRD